MDNYKKAKLNYFKVALEIFCLFYCHFIWEMQVLKPCIHPLTFEFKIYFLMLLSCPVSIIMTDRKTNWTRVYGATLHLGICPESPI